LPSNDYFAGEREPAPGAPRRAAGGNVLTQKLGPLEMWQWGAVAVLAVVMFRRIFGGSRRGGAGIDPSTGLPVGVDPTTGLPYYSAAGGGVGGVYLLPPSSTSPPAAAAPAASPYGNWFTGEPLTSSDVANYNALQTIYRAGMAQGKGNLTLQQTRDALTAVNQFYSQNPAQWMQQVAPALAVGVH
jgi:hypothetical protein